MARNWSTDKKDKFCKTNSLKSLYVKRFVKIDMLFLLYFCAVGCSDSPER